ncbi:deoxyribonuclease-1-like 1 [Trematomus bernacchii]|uniref:deoxyribonuclease-1-like 1 n=1 Tax=Trematomus bernacchii TaxID=40690 RepID=UPI00146E9A01|nr:deoxyribonuclease-1-like 1 [Trematomus bernacchii]
MKIAAFNVKRLGRTKVNKKDVREIIIKIVSQYSVVLLEEVMDVSGVAMETFLTHLNDYGDNKSNPYDMLCSESLGPNRYKEKFVYFYREKEVQILEACQYVDNDEHVIHRQPLVVLLKCPNTGMCVCVFFRLSL